MKIILAAGAIVIVVLAVLLFTLEPAVAPNLDIIKHSETATTTETGQTEVPDTSPDNPTGKLKAANFSGTLEEVNTGCLADGECYVVVDGKHITILMGWSQKTVGSIIGAPSIGDLESYIGKHVTVYAQDNSDGTYTLYGSAGFYVKVDGAGKGSPEASLPVASGSCIVGGCSGQLCIDESEGEMVTTCEYREAYACYKTAACTRQSSGHCGWTSTPELKACLLKDGVII
jgi:eight-cysteine-cluster-containing protein